MTYIGSCLANAFACLSYHFIKRHKEDLFYEMPHAMMGLHSGCHYVLTLRKTGADDIERFMSCLDDGEEHTYENAIKKAQSTLGVDCVVYFQMVDGELHLTIRMDADKMPWELQNDLECRRINYTFEKGLY